jgi:hypothetical protein
MQGYISLATGSSHYLELAVNLAISLKHNDPSRPFGLVTDLDMQIPEKYREVIDEVVRLPTAPGFHGCLNKLRLGDRSPFEETMFVDSDCLLVKEDMDRHWDKFRSPGFSIAGDEVTSGCWYSFEISDVLATLRIPSMVKLNSGVFYFRTGEQTDQFFATALDLVARHSALLGTYHRNKLQIADEPFIGAAMGVLGKKPLRYTPEEGSIMITTVNPRDQRFDVLDRQSHIVKHADFMILDRFLPRTSVVHSPSFGHFVQLKPKSVYLKAVADLRQRYGFPSFGG